MPHQFEVCVVLDRPIKTGQRIAIPLNLFFAKTLLAETEQRPTVLIHHSMRTSNQLISLAREKLFLKIGCAVQIGEAGEKLWSHARTEMREQIGGSHARELFAQTGWLLIELIKLGSLAALLERSARAARSLLRDSPRTNIA